MGNLKKIKIFFIATFLLLSSSCSAFKNILMERDVSKEDSPILKILLNENDFDFLFTYSGFGMVTEGVEHSKLAEHKLISDYASIWMNIDYKEDFLSPSKKLIVTHDIYLCKTTNNCSLSWLKEHNSLSISQFFFKPEIFLSDANINEVICIKSSKTLIKECRVFFSYTGAISVINFIYTEDDEFAETILPMLIQKVDERISVFLSTEK